MISAHRKERISVFSARFVASANIESALAAIVVDAESLGAGSMVEFEVNSKKVTFDGDDDTPLLWVLRDDPA